MLPRCTGKIEAGNNQVRIAIVPVSSIIILKHRRARAAWHSDLREATLVKRKFSLETDGRQPCFLTKRAASWLPSFVRQPSLSWPHTRCECFCCGSRIIKKALPQNFKS